MSTGAIRLQTAYQRFDRNSWLDGLLDKIDHGRNPPSSPGPSRSPSPFGADVNADADDVFGQPNPAQSQPGESYESWSHEPEPENPPYHPIATDHALVNGTPEVNGQILEQALRSTEAFLRGQHTAEDAQEGFQAEEEYELDDAPRTLTENAPFGAENIQYDAEGYLVEPEAAFGSHYDDENLVVDGTYDEDEAEDEQASEEDPPMGDEDDPQDLDGEEVDYEEDDDDEYGDELPYETTTGVGFDAQEPIVFVDSDDEEEEEEKLPSPVRQDIAPEEGDIYDDDGESILQSEAEEEEQVESDGDELESEAPEPEPQAMFSAVEHFDGDSDREELPDPVFPGYQGYEFSTQVEVPPQEGSEDSQPTPPPISSNPFEPFSSVFENVYPPLPTGYPVAEPAGIETNRTFDLSESVIDPALMAEEVPAFEQNAIYPTLPLVPPHLDQSAALEAIFGATQPAVQATALPELSQDLGADAFTFGSGNDDLIAESYRAVTEFTHADDADELEEEPVESDYRKRPSDPSILYPAQPEAFGGHFESQEDHVIEVLSSDEEEEKVEDRDGSVVQEGYDILEIQAELPATAGSLDRQTTRTSVDGADMPPQADSESTPHFSAGDDIASAIDPTLLMEREIEQYSNVVAIPEDTAPLLIPPDFAAETVDKPLKLASELAGEMVEAQEGVTSIETPASDEARFTTSTIEIEPEPEPVASQDAVLESLPVGDVVIQEMSETHSGGGMDQVIAQALAQVVEPETPLREAPLESVGLLDGPSELFERVLEPIVETPGLDEGLTDPLVDFVDAPVIAGPSVEAGPDIIPQAVTEVTIVEDTEEFVNNGVGIPDGEIVVEVAQTTVAQATVAFTPTDVAEGAVTANIAGADFPARLQENQAMTAQSSPPVDQQPIVADESDEAKGIRETSAPDRPSPEISSSHISQDVSPSARNLELEPVFSLPDPQKPPPDAVTSTPMPIPLLLRDPPASVSASLIVEPEDRTPLPSAITVAPPREESPTVFPDPYQPPADAQLPMPITPGVNFQSLPTETPSLYVEPPFNPPVIDITENEPSRPETPTELPDPALPPADSTLPPPLSPGNFVSQVSHSPSLIVEPAEHDPPADLPIDLAPALPSPTLLPDPKAAPPDSVIAAPLSLHHMPQHLREDTPSSSIVVEAPTDLPTPAATTSAGVSVGPSRADTPVSLPDRKEASASPQNGSPGERPVPDEVEDSSDPAALVQPNLLHTPDHDAPPEESMQAAQVDADATEVHRGAESQVEEAPLPDADTRTESDKSDISVPDAPGLARAQSSRLLHRHGKTPEPTASAAAVSHTHRRTRSSAVGATEPPVTRSHCFYRKLHMIDDGLEATVLVPQCTLFENDKLEEEGSQALDEATEDEERIATEKPMTEETPQIHPRLEAKLHRIVGLPIFAEGHCYLLEAEGKSLAPLVKSESKPATPARASRKRAATEVLTDDDEAHNTVAPLRDTPGTGRITRSTKKQAIGTAGEASSSNTSLGTPTKSPRKAARRITRSVSRVSDAGSEAALEAASAIGSQHRATRSVSAALAAAESRETTPIEVSVKVEKAPSSRRKSRRISTLSPVKQDQAPEDAGAEGSLPPPPHEAEPSTPRRSATISRDEDPYRPDEVGTDVSDNEISVAPKSPGRKRKGKGKAGTSKSDPAVKPEPEQKARRSTGTPEVSVVIDTRRATPKRATRSSTAHGEGQTAIESPRATGTRKRKARLSELEPPSSNTVEADEGEDEAAWDGQGFSQKETRRSKRQAISKEDDKPDESSQERKAKKRGSGRWWNVFTK